VVETYTFLWHEFILVQVTGVGINTEWGQVMASVSEDNGEETPLQVLDRLLIKTAEYSAYNVVFCAMYSPSKSIKYEFAGSSKWGCYVHWKSRSICSSACLHHSDHSVSITLGTLSASTFYSTFSVQTHY
jgi:hypothetical protein